VAVITFGILRLAATASRLFASLQPLRGFGLDPVAVEPILSNHVMTASSYRDARVLMIGDDQLESQPLD
jgi:hypothetical protein